MDSGRNMAGYTSDKEGIYILVELLVKKGVKRVVLSPGSRNAPLIMAFARDKRIRHYVVLDERSAAFMALGMAQQSGEAVAIACTSGTAPLNYGPAIAEAYYQRLPLIVITADRPQEWVDQDDSQTIRQNGVFANIVKDSWQVPAELRGEEERWYANRLINEAINCALKGRRGPVHINVPLREPLYGQRIYPEETVRSVEFLESAPTLASETWDSITERFQACRKVMVLAGLHLPDCRLKESLDKLAALDQVVVLSESPANLGSGRHIATIDRVLATVQEEEKADLAPDLLITFGGPLISRYVKAFLRQYKPAEHWSVDCSECPADTFKALTSHIHLEAADFFSALGERVKGRESDYALRWKQKKEVAAFRHEEFARLAGWCDWKAFSLIWPAIPAGTALQLANSTPVRYAQLFTCSRVVRVDSNRGTSGIDGSTSTAVGASVVNAGMTLLVTGDMSFLYDSNALWNPYIPARLKIIVMKNGGGGIFRFIPGPSGLEELEECFEMTQKVDVEGFARLHHFRYFYASDGDTLGKVLPEFFAETELPAILAVETPGRENAEMLRAYFGKLQHG
ncbi:2-succinyl-5-enolpyruvyl-6-hydroxy-3-cyclohexene-1-carboxylic-acid synthase [Odoribacter sp. Z80]|uniref:2-succinyl-5-enolpyruvyl-6-hydroxy-3- cyclohexene-1-carboxylic-acid synthase n=1 Tax=Odoribacter sp. Z80 TaxID=2304575 RepID=UPI001EFFEECC|nr:2-succinyl-5-enolpyruvyl-6-hydroxy-3-cyclohexene-1-carboxylic-acid synthase [Odoribacter sp. Z80]